MNQNEKRERSDGVAADRPSMGERSKVFLRRLGEFLRRLLLRFQQDRGAQLAAAVSYASQLALVPPLASSLALLTAFPAFKTADAQLKTFIFDALPPNQALRAAEKLDRLTSNVSRPTAPGI